MRYLLLFVLASAAAAQPVSVGLVFDTSGSMGPKLAQAKQLVSELLKTAETGDEFSLVQSTERPRLLSGFTSNADELYARVAWTPARGKSALIDAIYLSLQQAGIALNSRRAVIAITDGGDNASRYTLDDVRELSAHVRTEVFTVSVSKDMDIAALAANIRDVIRARLR